jgi:hypothetical protein
VRVLSAPAPPPRPITVTTTPVAPAAAVSSAEPPRPFANMPVDNPDAQIQVNDSPSAEAVAKGLGTLMQQPYIMIKVLSRSRLRATAAHNHSEAHRDDELDDRIRAEQSVCRLIARLCSHRLPLTYCACTPYTVLQVTWWATSSKIVKVPGAIPRCVQLCVYSNTFTTCIPRYQLHAHSTCHRIFTHIAGLLGTLGRNVMHTHRPFNARIMDPHVRGIPKCASSLSLCRCM